ncbi:hypothetical protein H6P81_005079 [Aristolochia fimbriata]|uniref:Uncharacterized protein n=1 Tax=Aristolochia fimbriata TaxID=158543 RepID=A0AAV7ETF3_ARIFI|nr:hypothetical protein H6P81_005079 [Aristolochia fimbriata]
MTSTLTLGEKENLGFRKTSGGNRAKVRSDRKMRMFREKESEKRKRRKLAFGIHFKLGKIYFLSIQKKEKTRKGNSGDEIKRLALLQPRASATFLAWDRDALTV